MSSKQLHIHRVNRIDDLANLAGGTVMFNATILNNQKEGAEFDRNALYVGETSSGSYVFVTRDHAIEHIASITIPKKQLPSLIVDGTIVLGGKERASIYGSSQQEYLITDRLLMSVGM